MSGVKVELANPNAYASPREYIEQHLVPAVAELHRITNELIAPGSTSVEEWGLDMVPSKATIGSFSPLDRCLDDSPKHVVFDGAAYKSIPTELLRQKQLKVQLTVVAYVKGSGGAQFRLVRDDGVVIQRSHFVERAQTPSTSTCQLPFGAMPNCVAPEQRKYIIEGKGLDPGAIPVCRRFSMSFVYI